MSQKKQTASKGKKGLVFILLAIAMLAGVGAVGFYAYTEINKLKSEVAKSKIEGDIKVNDENAAPIYVNLDTFTVSLKPDQHESDRVLYIGLTLKIKDEVTKALLEKHLPEVRSNLLVLFSQQTAAQLVTEDAKTELAEKIQQTVASTLTGRQRIMVTSVLFNAFILR